ncbi:MAG: hypothetical protein QMD50_02885 [Patescibacteria group bacterium]|nr:hypothetical protein [Patescibacteria group bacterium]
MKRLVRDNAWIHADDVDWKILERIGKVCAHFGLQSHRRGKLSLPEEDKKPFDKRDYSRASIKENFIELVAAREVALKYKKAGHRTVFDIIHHYFTARDQWYKWSDEFPNISLPRMSQKAGFRIAKELSDELINRAPLYAFYLHHIYQRYVCDFNFGINNGRELARKILKRVPLFNICVFLQYSEADFCREYRYKEDLLCEEAQKQIKGLVENEKVKVASGEVNGEPTGIIWVPKPKNYETLWKKIQSGEDYVPEILFPEIFQTSEITKIYASEETERSYILAKHPKIISHVEKERSKLYEKTFKIAPELLDHTDIVELLFQKWNYDIHIQSKILKPR